VSLCRQCAEQSIIIALALVLALVLMMFYRYVARFFATWPETNLPTLIQAVRFEGNDPENEVQCICNLYIEFILPHLNADINAEAEQRLSKQDAETPHHS
jgi:hypothetical protein